MTAACTAAWAACKACSARSFASTARPSSRPQLRGLDLEPRPHRRGPLALGGGVLDGGRQRGHRVDEPHRRRRGPARRPVRRRRCRPAAPADASAATRTAAAAASRARPASSVAARRSSRRTRSGSRRSSSAASSASSSAARVSSIAACWASRASCCCRRLTSSSRGVGVFAHAGGVLFGLGQLDGARGPARFPPRRAGPSTPLRPGGRRPAAPAPTRCARPGAGSGARRAPSPSAASRRAGAGTGAPCADWRLSDPHCFSTSKTMSSSAGEVLLGGVELQLRGPAPRLVLGDAGGLFDQLPPVGRPRAEDHPDLALLDDRVGLGAKAGVHQQLVDVAQPAVGAVDQVLALSGAIEPAGHLHVPDRLHRVEGQRHGRPRRPVPSPVAVVAVTVAVGHRRGPAAARRSGAASPRRRRSACGHRCR